MEISFKNKRALVTGAGKGIGRGIAKRLYELGADTWALSRTKEDLDTLKQECPNIQTVQCDVKDWDKTREIVQNIKDVDLLVNNAGIALISRFLDVTEEEIDKQFDINYKALFNISQVIAKSMVECGKGGSIVNISSQASMILLHGHAVYGSTKAAVDNLTKLMAQELGPHKIRVNAVNPTVTMTEMARRNWSDPEKSKPMLSRIPLGRFLEVSEIVDTVMYLLSDYASMIHGTTLPVEGGALTT